MQSSRFHRSLRLFLLTMAAMSLDAMAIEGGQPITPFGIFEFGTGMLPPPSDLPAVGFRAAHFSANRLNDNAGNRAPVSADLTINSYAVSLVKMTNATLLGGRYGFGVVVPYFDMNANFLGIPTPVGPMNVTGSPKALADVQVIPLILGWQPSDNFFVNTSLALQVPVGSYDKNRQVNPGVNHWTISPTLGFTYITPFGGEVSSNIQINFHTRNNATDYRSGMEYQQDFGIGQHIGSWTVGLGGYFSKQFTDDIQAGQAIGNRASVVAAGPAIQFFKPGSGLPLVTLHAYKELASKNRVQGHQIALKLGWTF